MKKSVKFITGTIAVAIIGVTAVTALAEGNPADGGVPVPDGYSRLVFSDEFDNDGAPDPTKWQYETGYIRNGEMQYYTRGLNAVCKDGLLVIEARNDSATINGEICPVTSASLTTKDRAAWKYGYVEVRAKLPSSLGTWPAIWMMPQENSYGKWPRSGEIDIMEHVGYNPDKVHFSAHTERFNHMRGTQRTYVIDAPEAVGAFHVYALKWTPDRLTWYYDGKERYAIDREKDSDWTTWPFDIDYYLILNLAFGGGWGGSEGVDLSSLPQRYEIDYVRVFQ
ncbi:MAG: glycoside hydrolase family 16 protein [Muribaculaceae bacterium]|nr:glycoside hydrolase family 16 protein [Muribaculaceae bacterium]